MRYIAHDYIRVTRVIAIILQEMQRHASYIVGKSRKRGDIYFFVVSFTVGYVRYLITSHPTHQSNQQTRRRSRIFSFAPFTFLGLFRYGQQFGFRESRRLCREYCIRVFCVIVLDILCGAHISMISISLYSRSVLVDILSYGRAFLLLFCPLFPSSFCALL